MYKLFLRLQTKTMTILAKINFGCYEVHYKNTIYFIIIIIIILLFFSVSFLLVHYFPCMNATKISIHDATNTYCTANNFTAQNATI